MADDTTPEGTISNFSYGGTTIGTNTDVTVAIPLITSIWNEITGMTEQMALFNTKFDAFLEKMESNNTNLINALIGAGIGDNSNNLSTNISNVLIGAGTGDNSNNLSTNLSTNISNVLIGANGGTDAENLSANIAMALIGAAKGNPSDDADANNLSANIAMALIGAAKGNPSGDDIDANNLSANIAMALIGAEQGKLQYGTVGETGESSKETGNLSERLKKTTDVLSSILAGVQNEDDLSKLDDIEGTKDDDISGFNTSLLVNKRLEKMLSEISRSVRELVLRSDYSQKKVDLMISDIADNVGLQVVDCARIGTAYPDLCDALTKSESDVAKQIKNWTFENTDDNTD
jgi:hypothetical protein